jgi:hypothetical protein
LKKKTDRSKNDRALKHLFAPTPQKALFPFDKSIVPAKRCTVRMVKNSQESAIALW